MACDKFETEGLLYLADELVSQDRGSYESHLESCNDCKQEIAEYRALFGDYSSQAILAEEPSAACDQRILAAMEAVVSPRKSVVSLAGFFTLFVQRVAIPAAIFVIALTVGIQISSHSGQKSVPVAKKSDTTTVPKDSTSDTGRIFIQGGSTGVIPVTLEDK